MTTTERASSEGAVGTTFARLEPPVLADSLAFGPVLVVCCGALSLAVA